MTVVAVVNPKGGVGKSTISCLLAARVASAYEVLLADTDKQGSACTWLKFRDEVDIQVPRIEGGVLTERIYANLSAQKTKWANIIVDCPAGDLTVARAVMKVADHIVVPAGGGQFAVSALADVLGLIRGLRDEGFETPVLAVLNNIEPRSTRIARQGVEALKALSEFWTPHPEVMWQRAPVELAISSGLGLHELKRGDRDERVEETFESIYQEIFHDHA